jgi:transcriptional regulator with XRE-family HTH domain
MPSGEWTDGAFPVLDPRGFYSTSGACSVSPFMTTVVPGFAKFVVIKKPAAKASIRSRRSQQCSRRSRLGLGLTFQQVQKYEKGANRIGAGRLQHIAQILQVPVESFFEGLPHECGPRRSADDAASVQYVTDYLATADGLQLTKAFMQIPNAKLRRSIVNLVEQIAGPEDQ